MTTPPEPSPAPLPDGPFPPSPAPGTGAGVGVGWVQGPPTRSIPTPSVASVRLRRLTLAATVLALVLGATAGAVATMLSGRIEADLVSTGGSRQAEVIAATAGMLLVATLVAIGLVAIRFLPRVAGTVARALGEPEVAAPDADLAVAPRPRVGLAVAPRFRVGLALASIPVRAGGAWYESPVAGRRRLATVGAAALAIGVASALVGALLILVASERDPARAGWTLVAVGGFVLTVTGAVAYALVEDVERRRQVAQAMADPGAYAWPEDGGRWWPAVATASLAVAAAVSASLGVNGVEERVCQSPVLECRWLTVQADQTRDDPRGETATVGYGLHRATGTRLGTLVIANGGPGIAGVAWWDIDYETLDPRILAAYDVVAFDPRGVGGSDGTDCPTASRTLGDTLDVDAGPAVLETYVGACLAEAGVDASSLARYGGWQVVEDIEAIRQDLGAERIVLYGESYGTATATRYALAHPDRLQALILDAALDITLDTDEVWLEAAAGFDTVLERTFDWCVEDPVCAEDLPEPAAAWDRVMGGLERTPATASFAGPDGRVAEWEITRIAAANAMSQLLYTEPGRMLAMRTLAAAARGDWVPLGRLVHPGDVMVRSDVLASDFTYHAAWCADRVETDAPREPAAQLAWLRSAPLASERMRDILLSGAPCSAWPVEPDEVPSSTLSLPADVPVVILTATADPITPPAIGRRLAERWSATADVYRIETRDGPHVTFARGDPCPDRPIVALLVDGVRPPRTTMCPGSIADPYAGVVRRNAYDEPLLFRAEALDDELYNHPDFVGWHGHGALTIGCRWGGTITVEERTLGHGIRVEGCAVVEDEPIRGDGSISEDGAIEYQVGTERGSWTYSLDVDGGGVIDGTWDGEELVERW